MKRRSIITIVVVLLLALVAVQTAAAQESSSSFVDDLLDDDEDGEVTRWEKAKSYFAGGLGVAEGRLSSLRDYAKLKAGIEEAPTASESKTEVQSFFNNHSEEFEAEANDRLKAGQARDVLEMTFVVGDDSATAYLVTDVDNETYTNATIVDETDREVDHTCRFEDSAAVDAPEKLEAFYESHVAADDPITERYIGRMTGKYMTDVSCSFLG